MNIVQLFRPRSLKYQLLFRTLFILALILLLIGVLQYALMKNFLYGNRAASIETQIDSVPDGFWQSLSSGTSAADEHTLFELETPGSTVAFVAQNGTFFDLFEDNYRRSNGDDADESPQNTVQAPHLPEQEYKNALSSRTDMTYQIRTDDGGNRQLLVLHRISDHGHPFGVVQVTTPTKPMNDILFRQLIIFGFLVACALCAGVMVFIPTLRRTLIPLSRMVETVSKVNAGNLEERFSTEHAQTEIALLASSFNGMLKRLETSFEAEREAKERMRQFIADASHELRTPLTTIHGFLEVLLRGAARDPVKLDKALHSIYGESERVNKLVQDLIFLARQDRAPTFTFTETRLDRLLLEMEPQLRLLAGERRVRFTVVENVLIRCDADKIKQVILNLFQNAVQHTDAHTGQIEVCLETNFAVAHISVRDNGTGIPQEHTSKLFERFYRVEYGRSRTDGGVGLGLSIAKSIVDHHGGTIDFDSKLGQGTVFNVWLPMK